LKVNETDEVEVVSHGPELTPDGLHSELESVVDPVLEPKGPAVQ
jgi:hypothetical protein